VIRDYPQFGRVWCGATVSAAGDAASWIALVALVLGSSHGSVAVLAICYTAPVVVGGLVAGWALDRFDRRRLLAADATVRAVVFAFVPLTAVFGVVSPPPLYSVAAAYGLLKMISLAGFPALIPTLVGDEALTRANALEGASYGLASLVGAGAGGLVIGAFGLHGAVGLVAFDAISYLVFAALLLTARTDRHPPQPAGQPGDRPAGYGLAALVRLVMRRPVLRSITVMFALFNVAEGMLLVFLPSRAATVGLGTGGYGYLVAALTGGELLAAALLVRRDWSRPLVPSILTGQAVAAAIVAMLIVDNAVTTILVMTALGFVSAPMTAWAQTLRMREVPAAMHGRLFAILRTGMQATPPIGAAIAPGLAGLSPVVLIGCAAAIMAAPAVVAAPDLLRSAPATPQPEGSPSLSPDSAAVGRPPRRVI
jgi:MFS family permease